MPFFVAEQTPDSLTLAAQESPVGCVRAMLLGMGLLALVVGGFLLAFGSTRLGAAGSVFGWIGLGFVLLGLFGVRKVPPPVPALVFDRQLQAVRVLSASPAAEVRLPFADVLDVRVETRSHHSSSSSGRGGTSRTTYSYHTYLQLRDGSRWLLTQNETKGAAETQRDRLAAFLLAAAAATSQQGAAPDSTAPTPPLPPLPPQLAHHAHGSHHTLRWQNPVPPAEVARTMLLLGFFAGALMLMLFALRQFEVDLPVFAYGVFAFIGLVFLFVAFWTLRRLYRDAHRRYRLELTPAAVAYVEESQRTGQELRRVEVPRADWYGLAYGYDDLGTGDSDQQVELLTRAAHARYLHRQLDGPGLPDVQALLTGHDQPVTLYFKRFTPAQRLALVQWVRAVAPGAE